MYLNFTFSIGLAIFPSLLFPKFGKYLLYSHPFHVYGAGFFVLIILLLILDFANLLINAGRSRLAVGFVLLVFSLIYIFLLFAGKPIVLFKTELFSPYRFSLNKAIPSLGHLVMLSILAAIFSNVFYRHFHILERQESKVKNYLFLTILLIIGALLISLYHIVFSHLISSSNINFETYKVLELNEFSVQVCIRILFFPVPVFLLVKVFQRVKLFRPGCIIS